ncbi:MAG: hypothetical protein AAF333_10230 [Planctomycetota bacterium]
MKTLRSKIVLTALLTLALTIVLGGCAAQRHLKHAEAALLADDPVSARHHFRRALEHDSKLADKPEFAEDFRVAKRDAAVVEGERALRDRQPWDAIERFEVALRLEPEWSSAVDGLVRAHQDAADQRHASALAAADAGDLPAARAALDDALQHVPDHPRANAALVSLTLAEDRQPEPFRQASRSLSQRDWDAGLAALRRSISSVPDFLPARAVLPAALDDAAQDHLDRGRSALAAGQFDDADAALRRVSDYRPEHPELDPALGAVHLARADADFAADRTGAAWVEYRKAEHRLAGHPDRDAARAGAQRAADLIRDRHRLSIAVTAQDDDRRSEALADRVRRRLARNKSAALRLDQGGEQVLLTIDRLSLPAHAVRTEHRQHAYDVEFDVPNPEVANLQHELSNVGGCLHDLRRREARLCVRYEHLQHHDPVAAQAFYPKLHRVRCDIEDAERKNRRLHRKLRHTSTLITAVRTEHWPYTVEHHKRTAKLDASVELIDLPAVHAKVRIEDTDTVIHNARPDLGLAEDPLRLRTDADLRDELIGCAADTLAKRIAAELVDRRVASLRDEARSLQTVDPIAARESRVAADLLGGRGRN